MFLFTLLLGGLFGALLVWLVLRLFLRPGSRFDHRLRSWLAHERLQRPWAVGLLLFVYNAVLFGGTFGITILGATTASRLNLPMPLLFIAVFAVAASIFGWALLGNVWQGSAKSRVQIALIGSSFYWLLLAYAIIAYRTLPPATPHNDPFMQAIALFMLGVIAVVAAFICLLVVAWPRTKHPPHTPPFA